MYAVIESGGKQHRVQEGEVLKLEKLEVATGETISFDRVLLVGTGSEVKIGAPFVDGSTVAAEVLGHGRHDKVRIIKFRRRKHYKRETGHRQWYTAVRITGINAG
ncbi:MAG: 50S ribosomal protein L21 [Pseudomonadales bacterium]|nr:50S ribosomal protein L21 [Pseudomonadales bacterium]